jgi:3alpha(or 20beta)-hydroxysteroid dehydrogenase
MTISSADRAGDLEDRVVMVSGAARGQGRAIAERALAEGARVIAGDILDTVSDLAAFDPDSVHTCRLDITDHDSWEQALRIGVDRFGRLDGLVNNAGVLHRARLDQESPADFERLWRVNCFGALLGMQAALPHLRESGVGAIVNTLSTVAITAWPEHGAYASSKWALRGLTKVAALEMAPQGIRVNAVLPGPVLTPMVIRNEDPGAAQRLADTPIGRAGLPEDISELVIFLLSDRSSFMTGAEVTIDGGQTTGTALKR